MNRALDLPKATLAHQNTRTPANKGFLLLTTCYLLLTTCYPLFASFGDYLFDKGDYYNAITEYRRELFFHPESETIKFKIAESYEKNGDIRNATEYLKELGLKYYNDQELMERISLSLAKNYIALGEYSLARIELIDLQNKEQKAYLMGITYLLEKRWGQAGSEFEKTDDAKLVEFARKGENLPVYSPRKAGILSAIIPGAGHIYTGKIKTGIMSFLLTGLSGYLTVLNIKNMDYKSALLIGSLGLNRFYFGGIQSAIKSANRKNKNKQEQYLEEIKELPLKEGSRNL